MEKIYAPIDNKNLMEDGFAGVITSEWSDGSRIDYEFKKLLNS